MITRPGQLLMLIGPTVRRARWETVAGCVVVAAVATWLVASYSRDATMGHALSILRWAAVVLNAGVATVLDDPTERDLAGAGVRVGCRRFVGLLVVGVPTALGWAVIVTLPEMPMPWVALSVEAAALVLLGVAVASMQWARAVSVPAGVVAVALPSVLLVAASFFPARWALVADPSDVAGWHDAHTRWAMLVVGAAVAIVVAARDPARRAAWRVLHPARPRSPSSALPATASSKSLMETS